MSAAPPVRGLYLETSPDPTFGLFHPAGGEPRDVSVLICPPFGWEDFCSYRSRLAWAQELAAGGYAALRIDLPATGDSGGDPDDPARLEAWTSAVAAAAAWLRESTGCRRVATIGIGLGGLVACRAMAAGAAIDDLVLWAVPARGRTLLRELRVFARLNATEVDASDALDRPAMPEPPPLADGSLEVGGFLLDAETVSALEALDLTKLALPARSSRRALMLERDGIDVDRRLREHLESAGVEVSVAPGPGFGRMMAHPQQAKPPTEEFAVVADWLGKVAGPGDAAAPGAGGAPETAEIAHGEARVRETPISIEQPCGRLWGVLCEPIDGPTAPLRGRAAQRGRPAPNRPGAAVGRAGARLGGAGRADSEDRPRGARRLRRRRRAPTPTPARCTRSRSSTRCSRPWTSSRLAGWGAAFCSPGSAPARTGPSMRRCATAASPPPSCSTRGR